MGCQYRPVDVVVKEKGLHTVGLIDTGADETVISTKLADALGCRLKGDFRATSASKVEVKGKYTRVKSIVEKWSGKFVEEYRIGVTDEPFADDEGIDIIIGVDFLQDTNYELRFTNK